MTTQPNPRKGVTRYYEIWLRPVEDWWTRKPRTKPRKIHETTNRRLAEKLAKTINANRRPGPENIRAEYYIRYSPTQNTGGQTK